MGTKLLNNQRQSFHKQRGVAAIEFAFLIVPMLLMLFGVTEYGRAIYQYNTLAKSVRDATRHLTAHTPGTGWSEAQNLAVCGYTDCSGHDALAPNLDTGMVEICDATNIDDCPGVPHSGVSTGQGTVNLVTVKIAGYRYQPIFLSFPLRLIGGSEITIGLPGITFDDIQNTMRQPL